jgi:hypothetical protein
VPLKLLCAGCSEDERPAAATSVRQALGARAQAGSWTVSLVRVGAQWSVTLDAPGSGVRSLNLLAPDARLREAILEALDGPQPAQPQQRQPAGAPGRRSRDGACGSCGKAFVVHYDAVEGEPERDVPVACPHCWQVNHVLVGENAAETSDYRAEKG